MAKLGEIRKKTPGSKKGAKKGKEAAPSAPREEPAAAPEPPPPPDVPERPFEVLICRSGENEFAVSLDQVERVEMVEHVVRVPNLPDYVEGVVTVRGDPVPAVSFRKLFGLDPLPFDLATRFLVVRVGERRVGFIVDRAREILRIDPGEVRSPPDMIHGLAGEYLRGIVRRGDRAFLLVHLEAVLALADRGVSKG
ncbi:MAG: hypothetical protein Kow0092_25850 [Deferrisomatales bacterium]